MKSLPELLKDEFHQRRERNVSFSLRSFARWLDISPAQLSQLMSGKRPPTLGMTKKVALRLGLSPDEKLELMATSLPALANEYNESLRRDARKVLSEDEFRVIADWYHFAILSLTKLPEAKPDPRWLSRRLGISVSTAGEALSRLIRLGLVQVNPKFKQIGDPLMVSSEVPSAAIQRFHKQILGLATERIETTSNSDKDFQATILAVNPAKLPLAKKMIDDFVSKIEKVLESGAAKEVYSFAVQLFPLSQNSFGGEDK